MIVTEEQAAQKACPFAVSFNASHGMRVIYSGSSSREFEHAKCIGAACMAWDWLDPEAINPNTYIIGDGTTARDRLDCIYKTGESKEDFDKRITEAYLADGFERVEKYSVCSVAGWKKPHPERRGQCQRTLVINQE